MAGRGLLSSKYGWWWGTAIDHNFAQELVIKKEYQNAEHHHSLFIGFQLFYSF